MKPTPPNRKLGILIAAERMFAERGYHGVSIRNIAKDAGVPLALVGYHFGSKLDLYHAIFRHRGGHIEERLAALAVARSRPARQRLHEIVRAFVEPVLRLAADRQGRLFLRVVARGISDQLAEDDKMVREIYDPLAHAFIDAFQEAVPGVPRGTMAWSYQFALGALIHHVIDRRVKRLSRGENRAGDFAVAEPLLIEFIVQGIRGACKAASKRGKGGGAHDQQMEGSVRRSGRSRTGNGLRAG